MIKLILQFLKTHLRHISVTISSAPVIFLCVLIAWENPGTGAQRWTYSQVEVVTVRHSTPALLKHGWHCTSGWMGGRDCPWKPSWAISARSVMEIFGLWQMRVTLQGPEAGVRSNPSDRHRRWLGSDAKQGVVLRLPSAHVGGDLPRWASGSRLQWGGTGGLKGHCRPWGERCLRELSPSAAWCSRAWGKDHRAALSRVNALQNQKYNAAQNRY